MRLYDVIVVLSPKHPEQEAMDVLNRILERFGVHIRREEKWGYKRLPHPISGLKRAFFVYKSCKIDAKQIQELNRELLLNAHVLRFMLKRA